MNEPITTARLAEVGAMSVDDTAYLGLAGYPTECLRRAYGGAS